MIVSVMTEITSQNLTPRCKHMPGQLRSLPISCGFRLVGEDEVHTCVHVNTDGISFFKRR
jgi:hypothetical protein